MAAVIELELDRLGQLFNSLDPSPFHEKDLDRDAEEFIVSWARELPRHEELRLVVHLREPHDAASARDLIETALRHYFTYRAEMTRRELAQLLSQGRTSLLIGVLVLAAFLVAGELLTRSLGKGPEIELLQTSLLIGGWVAMWRPMEILLHDWWPVARKQRLQERLGRIEVEMRPARPRPG